MDTGTYVSPDEILSIVLPSVGDRDMSLYPQGFYHGLIQKALEAVALDTFFQTLHHDYFDFDWNSLSAPLPDGCFNTRAVYIFNGDHCNYEKSIKLWWKRNYYTKGKGYIANDKGNNFEDPFMTHRGFATTNRNKQLIHEDQEGALSVNQKYFYNIQLGKLMVSSFCKGQGNGVHIVYNGTGCKIGDLPIIPIFLRTVIEDYVCEAVLRMRMAEAGPRNLQSLHALYDGRLNAPYDGSLSKARQMVIRLNSSQKADLKEYLSRPAFGIGM